MWLVCLQHYVICGYIFRAFVHEKMMHGSLVFVCLLPQVAGRYRVMVESSMASADDIIFNCGDVIQLLHEELSGMW